MLSEKQLEANRANAHKSTGPTTEAGKRKSSMNGFKHGLTGLAVVMTQEDRSAMEAFTGPYILDLAPQGAVEQQLAQTIAQDNFRINRIHAIEENTFALGELRCSSGEGAIEEIHHAIAQAQTFAISHKAFNNLSLYEQRLRKGIQTNLKLYFEMQDRRRAREEDEAKTKPLTRTATITTERNGFEFAPAKYQPKPIREELPIAA